MKVKAIFQHKTQPNPNNRLENRKYWFWGETVNNEILFYENEWVAVDNAAYSSSGEEDEQLLVTLKEMLERHNLIELFYWSEDSQSWI
jgi:hypothetical protein